LDPRQFEVTARGWEDALGNPPAACVLESATAPNLGELRKAYERISVPVLLIVTRAEIQDVLAWVRSSDDVCLDSAPDALIEFRLRKLLKSPAAVRDSLTGLLSRKDFHQAMKQASAEASRQQPVSLILLDLDHFKAANDRHGHDTGDAILKECGRVLAKVAGEEVLAARFGGEEFSLLLRAQADSAHRFAECVRLAISRADFPEGIAVTCSLGVATATEPTPEEAIYRQADEAMYAAKAQGRNQTMSFADLEEASRRSGDDVKLTGLQNRARVLVERVANLITLKSKRIVEDVQAEAETDSLTQFFTRRSFDRRLQMEFDSSSITGPLTLALIDLDHFGQVNKQFGWPTGDKVLKDVASLIRNNVRGTDWIGRYGGEEFCIVMPHTSLQNARDVLERIRVIVQNASFATTKGETLRITLSMGAAMRTSEIDPAELIEKASSLTLMSKQLGRNRLMVEA
jgi:diguanylate cyclase (GGDEF)-like protein